MIDSLTKKEILFFKKTICAAGDRALSIQKKNINARRKDDKTIVTDADYYVQNYLFEKVTKKFPDFNLISEENINKGTCLRDDAINIIIDPIDGTAMFSMHLPFWCVSVGIFHGYSPLYGFVYSPGCELLFHCDDDFSYLNSKPLLIWENMPVDNETNIFYSSEIKGVKLNFPGKARNLGSTALHACLAADNSRNRVLAFIGKSYLWDWAGAIPIVTKAGSHIRYLNGGELDFEKIAKNNFELEDYAVIYNCSDFNEIRKILSLI